MELQRLFKAFAPACLLSFLRSSEPPSEHDKLKNDWHKQHPGQSSYKRIVVIHHRGVRRSNGQLTASPEHLNKTLWTWPHYVDLTLHIVFARQ